MLCDAHINPLSIINTDQRRLVQLTKKASEYANPALNFPRTTGKEASILDSSY